MNSEIYWLANIKEKAYSFIQEMNIKKDYSFFKYSYSGDLYDHMTKWGLGQTVFAIKILYMIDKINNLEPINVSNLIKSINSFQIKNGYITDNELFKQNNNKIVINPLAIKNNINLREKVKRAETRQSFAALLALNSKPNYPFIKIPYSKKGIESYLTKLDWTKPWDAGSHFSHLLFFYHNNKNSFGLYKEETDEFIDHAISFINKLQSPTDGCWYNRSVSDLQKINGAMKIMTGLAASNKLNFLYPEKIIDTSLKIADSKDACNNFNVIFVLYCCKKLTNYRSEEINTYCYNKIKQFKQYYYENKGGFSFHLNKANDCYYNVKITKGLNEPDIHGTVMFLWGITLISKIMDFNLKLKEPII